MFEISLPPKNSKTKNYTIPDEGFGKDSNYNLIIINVKICKKIFK